MTSANHEYLVEAVARHAPRAAARVLDHGCGAGEIVRRLLAAGYDCQGAEVFYEGGSYREEAADLLGDRIREIGPDGRLPFPDQSFDVVLSNQVLEHVPDLEAVIAEIHRVLAPDGVLVALFPTREVWREGHIGIPFAHRLPRGSRLRRGWTHALHRLGLGYFREGTTRREWVDSRLEWIDRWTWYRPYREVRSCLGARFDVAEEGAGYLRWRLARHPRIGGLSGLAGFRVLDPILAYLCSRLAGRVFVLRRRAGGGRVRGSEGGGAA